jgi:L-fuconolactonase
MPRHQALVLALLSAYPQLPIVIDHLGLPERHESTDTIADRMAALARHDNCHLKVAGMAGLSHRPAPHDDVWPLLRICLQRFGASRLLWGSDFPSSVASSDYAAEFHAMNRLPFLSPGDRELLMGQTALRLFGGVTSAAPA